MARTFPRLAAAACCCYCLALLLPPPVQCRPAGPAAGGLAVAGRRDHHPLFPEPRFDAAAEPAAPVKARRATWSTAASARPELRAVPGGPDPLHHHGSPSRRPEQERTPWP